jgi:hypothetical protein
MNFNLQNKLTKESLKIYSCEAAIRNMKILLLLFSLKPIVYQIYQNIVLDYDLFDISLNWYSTFEIIIPVVIFLYWHFISKVSIKVLVMFLVMTIAFYGYPSISDMEHLQYFQQNFVIVFFLFALWLGIRSQIVINRIKQNIPQLYDLYLEERRNIEANRKQANSKKSAINKVDDKETENKSEK